jgi:hypothetical protein
MKTSELPIYRVTYQLLERITKYARNFPRDMKLSLAGRLQQECVELVLNVYRANAARQGRAQYINVVLERVQVVELLIRLCRDLHLVSTAQYAAVIELTDQIGRQAQGWRKASKA